MSPCDVALVGPTWLSVEFRVGGSFGYEAVVGPTSRHYKHFVHRMCRCSLSSGGASGRRGSKVRAMTSLRCGFNRGSLLLLVAAVVLFTWWCSSSSSPTEMHQCGRILGANTMSLCVFQGCCFPLLFVSSSTCLAFIFVLFWW
jgi:hypothetical protein